MCSSFSHVSLSSPSESVMMNLFRVRLSNLQWQQYVLLALTTEQHLKTFPRQPARQDFVSTECHLNTLHIRDALIIGRYSVLADNRYPPIIVMVSAECGLHNNAVFFIILCIHVHSAVLLETTTTTTTVLRPFFWDHPGEPGPEDNFWTLWYKGRLTEADKLTIRLGATPSGLTSAHLHHPPIFLTGRMPFLPPNQRCQSTEGN